jgi:hypothetical protein
MVEVSGTAPESRVTSNASTTILCSFWKFVYYVLSGGTDEAGCMPVVP